MFVCGWNQLHTVSVLSLKHLIISILGLPLQKVTRFPFGLQLCLSCYDNHLSSRPASRLIGILPEVLLLTCYSTFFSTPRTCGVHEPMSSAFGLNVWAMQFMYSRHRKQLTPKSFLGSKCNLWVQAYLLSDKRDANITTTTFNRQTKDKKKKIF